MIKPNQQPQKEDKSPYKHQEWIVGHLATRKLGDSGRVNLETPEGKPVVINGFSDPAYGERVNVSRGSFADGDLDIDRTVSLDRVPGSNLPEINPIRTSEDAQEIINDLRKAS